MLVEGIAHERDVSGHSVQMAATRLPACPDSRDVVCVAF